MAKKLKLLFKTYHTGDIDTKLVILLANYFFYI